MRPTKKKKERKKQFQQHLIRVVIFRRVRKTTSNANEMENSEHKNYRKRRHDLLQHHK